MIQAGNVIAKEVHRKIAPVISVEPIHKEAIVADSTIKYIIRTTEGDVVLVVSSPASPLLVKRAVDRQRSVKSCLTGHASDPIEAPVLEGYLGSQSYAAWRRRKTISKNRVVAKMQKVALTPRVYRWLCDVAVQTLQPADPVRLANNALRLCQIDRIPSEIKIMAKDAAEAFIDGRTPAIQIAQHGDLWIGNILRSGRGFVIIDWPGARVDGSPFFDLVKLALSVGASRSAIRSEIVRISNVLGCAPIAATAYVLSGLGALHSELECFPEASFIQLCVQKVSLLSSILFF